MTKKVTKEEPISLRDGQLVKIDGEEFIFDKGHFKLNLPDVIDNNKHFYLHFRDVFAKKLDTNEINGCPIIYNKDRVVIDIAPLLEKLFTPEARGKMREFKGITEVGFTDSEEEGICLPFLNSAKRKIKSSLSTMLDMSIVNQKQRQGFDNYIDNILGDFWSDFWK